MCFPDDFSSQDVAALRHRILVLEQQVEAMAELIRTSIKHGISLRYANEALKQDVLYKLSPPATVGPGNGESSLEASGAKAGRTVWHRTTTTKREQQSQGQEPQRQ